MGPEGFQKVQRGHFGPYATGGAVQIKCFEIWSEVTTHQVDQVSKFLFCTALAPKMWNVKCDRPIVIQIADESTAQKQTLFQILTTDSPCISKCYNFPS